MTAFKERARLGEPSYNGIALHQDQQYIKTKPNGLVGCWIALNDTDAGNGGFMVVPASHRRGLRTSRHSGDLRHRSHSIMQHMRDRDGREWDEVVNTFQLVGIDAAKAVVLDIARGGAVFFNGFLVHGSRSNFSEHRERLAVALHYVRDGTWVYRKDLNETLPVLRPIAALRSLTRKIAA